MSRGNADNSMFRLSGVDLRPLHVQLRELILRLISEGHFRVGDFFPGRHAMLESLKISSTPYHKVINELVHEGILGTRKGKGVFVRSLQGRRAPDHVVTLLVAEPEILEHLAFTEVINGILDVIVPRNFSLKFSFFYPNRPEREIEKKLSSMWTEGVIVPFCAATRDEHLRVLEQQSFPSVLLGKSYPGFGFGVVETDSSLAIDRAIEDLPGKISVAYLGQPVEAFYARHIVWFESGCRKKGRTITSLRHISCGFSQSAGASAMQELLKAGSLPDLIIAEDDYVACGALSVMDMVKKRTKLLTMGGFLKHLYPLDAHPVIDLNYRKIGRAAATLLLEALDGQQLNRTVLVESDYLP